MTKSAMATPGVVLGQVNTVKMEGSCRGNGHIVRAICHKLIEAGTGILVILPIFGNGHPKPRILARALADGCTIWMLVVNLGKSITS